MKRPNMEGVALGLIAGLIFGVTEMIGAAMIGASPLLPLRMFASVVLGEAALETHRLYVFGVGVVVHLGLSAMCGWIYLRFNERRSTTTQTSWSRQAALGLLFGVVLWLVFFQGIARIGYPWFLDTPQFAQMLMHALFFGLPLGLMYADFEGRIQHVRAAHRAS